MRRSLLVLLAFVLLAQFSWARAAAYCQHEKGNAPAAAHWGHHEHAHADLGQKKSPDSKLMADADCNVCHASCAHALSIELDARVAPGLSGALVPRASPPLASAPPGAPDRPNWSALA